MHDTWHDTDVAQLSNVLKALRKLFAVLSQETKLARPDAGWRVQFQELIRDLAWIKLIIIDLIIEIGGE